MSDMQASTLGGLPMADLQAPTTVYWGLPMADLQAAPLGGIPMADLQAQTLQGSISGRRSSSLFICFWTWQDCQLISTAVRLM
jgi:hypothetical protein